MPEFDRDRRVNPAVLLVATNLNDLDRLMLFAFEQAAATGARLLLLHVVSAGGLLSEGPDGVFELDRAGVLERAAGTLEPWCSLARRQGVACESLVLEGNAAAQISAAVREFEADLLLIGAHNGSREGKSLLGAVAEMVLRTVNVPVLTVGTSAHLPTESSGREALVLHATALRPASGSSAALASQIAGNNLARLVLLHVLPPAAALAVAKMVRPSLAAVSKNQALQQHQASQQQQALQLEDEPKALGELRRMAAHLSEEYPVAVETCLTHGNPLIEILAVAAERRASLIVLDSAPRAAFENLTRDRVATQVIAHARCPVLSLRDSAARAAEVDPEQMAIRR